ncbi:hypothetical protein ZWY2020_005461 [Hordeum vulgare]|nr:hypothetical protein ZWY2020_005461 [Hordeum vulgare]
MASPASEHLLWRPPLALPIAGATRRPQPTPPPPASLAPVRSSPDPAIPVAAGPRVLAAASPVAAGGCSAASRVSPSLDLAAWAPAELIHAPSLLRLTASWRPRAPRRRVLSSRTRSTMITTSWPPRLHSLMPNSTSTGPADRSPLGLPHRLTPPASPPTGPAQGEPPPLNPAQAHASYLAPICC